MGRKGIADRVAAPQEFFGFCGGAAAGRALAQVGRRRPLDCGGKSDATPLWLFPSQSRIAVAASPAPAGPRSPQSDFPNRLGRRAESREDLSRTTWGAPLDSRPVARQRPYRVARARLTVTARNPFHSTLPANLRLQALPKEAGEPCESQRLVGVGASAPPEGANLVSTIMRVIPAQPPNIPRPCVMGGTYAQLDVGGEAFFREPYLALDAPRWPPSLRRRHNHQRQHENRVSCVNRTS
jgi:hypothetical protein